MALKILIADDEVYIRMLLEQTFEDLQDKGVEIIFADNGQKALSLIYSQQPNLVFLDVMMPMMDGMDVCKAIKKDPSLQNQTYIVLLTAKGQSSDRLKGSEIGADLYMTKPFDPEHLRDLAGRILGIEI